ncbi:MAG: energy transducer TonB [Sphingomicrobium sp.]
MKALGGVVIVHVGLALLILSGLSVGTVTRTVERLKTFDIDQALAPPPPPPPRHVSERAKDEQGASAKKALPTPVVAPQPRIVLPARPPVIAAPIASSGSAATAGAATAGTGTGAGGSGSGAGGGGTGQGTGFTPARMLNKIPDREYRRIAAGRIPRGSAAIRFRANADGSIADCHIIRSSGDSQVDTILCEAATRYLKFAPARDPSGRAIAQDISYTPTWRPNY